jgi:hypothetical protein
MSHRSVNALFKRAVDAPSLVEFAAWLGRRTSGVIFKGGFEVAYEMLDPISDEISFVFDVLHGLRMPASRLLAGLSSRRLVFTGSVSEENGLPVLDMMLKFAPRDLPLENVPAESTIHIDPAITSSFTGDNFAFTKFKFQFYSSKISTILLEEFVKALNVHREPMVAHSPNYEWPMCYYTADEPAFGFFVMFCRDVVAPMISEKHASGIADITLALDKYFDVKVQRPGVITFKDLYDMFGAVDTREKYDLVSNRFSIALEIIHYPKLDLETSEYFFEFVNTAKRTRDMFVNKDMEVEFPMERLSADQRQLLTKPYKENLMSGAWRTFREFNKALQDLQSAIRSKYTFDQISNRDASVLRNTFDLDFFIEHLPKRTTRLETFDEVKYAKSEIDVEVILLNELGTSRLRINPEHPRNVIMHLGRMNIDGWLCGDWDQSSPLETLKFVQLVNLNDEPRRPKLDTCNAYVKRVSELITEEWYCWVTGTLEEHVFRRLFKITEANDKKAKTEETTVRDAQGALHSSKDGRPARIVRSFYKDFGTGVPEIKDTQRLEYWCHGQLHSDSNAAVQWFDETGSIVKTQVWRRGMAFIAPLIKPTTLLPESLAHPILQAGGSCYISAVFNILFNSPVFKHALISLVNRYIDANPTALPLLQRPFVTRDNNFLILQAAYQMLCSKTVRSSQVSVALTGAFTERLCRFGGDPNHELKLILQSQLGLVPERDFKLVEITSDRGSNNLFYDAAVHDVTGSTYVLLGAFLSYRTGPSGGHVVTALNFPTKSKNFVFDSNGRVHHYDWVNQPSTGILKPGETFFDVVYILVSSEFYAANLVKSEENTCKHIFNTYTERGLPI